MIPINGFFEYGIMALSGAVGMVGLAIWTLSSDQKNESKENTVEFPSGKSDSETFLYKKAA